MAQDIGQSLSCGVYCVEMTVGEEVGALHIQRPSTSGHSGTYLACGTADLGCVGQPWPFGD